VHTLSKHSSAEMGTIEGISAFSSQIHAKKSPSNAGISSTKITFQFKDVSYVAKKSRGGVIAEDAGWKSIVYNSDYKSKDLSIPISFVTNDLSITDQTKFTIDGNESKTVIIFVLM
jgi:hypothetical protein